MPDWTVYNETQGKEGKRKSGRFLIGGLNIIGYVGFLSDCFRYQVEQGKQDKAENMEKVEGEL